MISDELIPLEIEEPGELGSSFELADEGWQEIAYTEPEDDWSPLPEGGLESPDGRVRSYPLDDPAGQ